MPDEVPFSNWEEKVVNETQDPLLQVVIRSYRTPYTLELWEELREALFDFIPSVFDPKGPGMDSSGNISKEYFLMLFAHVTTRSFGLGDKLLMVTFAE